MAKVLKTVQHIPDVKPIIMVNPFTILLPREKAAEFVVVGKELKAEDVVFQFSLGYRNVVQNLRPDVDRELKISTQLIHEPRDFMDNPLQWLGFNENILEVTFNSTAQRDPNRQLIVDHLGKMPAQRMQLDAVKTIYNELHMNAIFNAPVDSNGVHIFQDRPRNEQVDYPDGKQSKFFVAWDKERYLIGCEDPYGSINEKKFLDRLHRCYVWGNVEVRSSGVGAGIGCRMIFDLCTSLYIAAEKGKRTIFVCVLTRGSRRQADSFPKNIHLSIK